MAKCLAGGCDENMPCSTHGGGGDDGSFLEEERRLVTGDTQEQKHTQNDS